MQLADLVIYGSGGLARECEQIVDAINAQRPAWRLRGFLDDDEGRHGTKIHEHEVVGGLDWLREHPTCHVAIGVGSPPARRRIALAVGGAGNPFATLRHPGAWLGSGVEVGEGSLITAGCLITTDIRIGRHVLVNIGTTVGHDAVIGDHVTINPGCNISGNVQIGEGADVGAGVAMIPGIKVGRWSVVGAGSVLIRDVAPDTTVVGNPARVVKERPAGWHES